MLGSRRLLSGAVLAGLVAAGPVAAVDSEGRFHAHGWGNGRCSELIERVTDENSVDRPLFIGWVAGYLTAANIFQDETYDIAPITPPVIVAEALAGHCEDNPDAAVVEVMNGIAQQLHEQRLTSREPMLDLEHEGRSVVVHQDLLRRTQAALQDLGFYEGATDGAYGPMTQSALSRFQEDIGLEVTGLPDAPTLQAIFLNRGPERGAGG